MEIVLIGLGALFLVGLAKSRAAHNRQMDKSRVDSKTGLKTSSSKPKQSAPRKKTNIHATINSRSEAKNSAKKKRRPNTKRKPQLASPKEEDAHQAHNVRLFRELRTFLSESARGRQCDVPWATPKISKTARGIIAEQGEEAAFYWLLSAYFLKEKGEHTYSAHLLSERDMEGLRSHVIDNLTSDEVAALHNFEKGMNNTPNDDNIIQDGNSVILGTSDKGVVGWNNDGHLITVAPTGAGKGQCHVIPNVSYYRGSVFVLDVKGENFDKTGVTRIQMHGDKVFKFAPFDKETSFYNPLHYVDEWSDCVEMAMWLVPEPDPNRPDYFTSRARDLVTALVYLVSREDAPTMAKVVDLLFAEEWEDFNEDGKPQAGIFTRMVAMDDELLTQTAKDMQNMLARAPKEFSAVVNSLKQQMNIWRMPEVKKATSQNTKDFTPHEIRMRAAAHEHLAELMNDDRNGGVSVYVCIPPRQIKACKPLLRVMVGQFLSTLMTLHDDEFFALGSDHHDLPTNPILFMLDEFPQLGYMETIEQALEVARSYKIRLWLFSQNLAQLKQHYPSANAVLSGCAVQAFMNCNDTETARYVSERLGKETDLTGNVKEVAPVSDLMVEEFEDDVIVFQRGKDPFKTSKLLAYEDPDLKDMMRESQEVKIMLEDRLEDY